VIKTKRPISAGELFLTGQAAITIRASKRISLHLIGRADYLTSAGAEFEAPLNDGRDKLFLGASAKLYFRFGEVAGPGEWVSDKDWTREKDASELPIRPRRDSDGDGVADSRDQCLNTPAGAVVSADGCPVDGDRDGVPDGMDDCPGTLAAARNTVDIHGCPVDSDFDGIEDFADSCAFNRVGAIVGPNGCPLDSDNDGVPDGLDDCPYTLVGVEVDRQGCIDLTMLAEPMVLNIDYASGSFEVDPHNRKRIERLAGLLNFVTDIRLDIIGYTDNIGTSLANKGLSEKRANRVKGILEVKGVASDRIKVFGRGETNFVASNQTAEGRARNRRIEIVFYK
jgi:outer membrane protein OmpA-like peptidoglycan-associated protein